jgi:hemerythrin
MAFMEWDTTFSTGIDEIDQQHTKIIVLINQLCDKLKRGENKTRIEELLNELIEHSEIHFNFNYQV